MLALGRQKQEERKGDYRCTSSYQASKNIFLLLLVCVGSHLSRLVSKGQRTTCGSRFSFAWVLGIDLRLSTLVTITFLLLNL